MAGPDAARARWAKLADRLRVQDWTLVEIGDAFAPSGELDYWYVYEHRDGRRATVSADGRCTDPELEALLVARDRAQVQIRPSVCAGVMQLLAALIRACLGRSRGSGIPRHGSRLVIR